VRSLSGGERNRLLLARLFTRPANVLVLDEPTNDLDIDTLELLEDVIAQYSGTVFLVSHDRAFLDNVVTQVIALKAMVSWKNTRAAIRTGSTPRRAWRPCRARWPARAYDSQHAGRPAKPEKQRSNRKLSYNETRELAALPDELPLWNRNKPR
jgi:ATP-binding cassette subfamily F protein uup